MLKLLFPYLLCLTSLTTVSAQIPVGEYPGDVIFTEEIKMIYPEQGVDQLNLPDFLSLIQKTWDTLTYLNEYDGEYETRLVRGETFFHQEALAYQAIGNSEINDSSIVLILNDDFHLQVGMSVNELKKQFPKSFEMAKDFYTEDRPHLKVMGMLYGTKIDNEVFLYDNGLYIIFDSVLNKVTNIWSQ